MSTIATSPRDTARPTDTQMPERPTHGSEAGTRVARNLGALLGGQAITWTVTLAWTMVVPRALGPAELGLLVSAQSISGVLGIVLGMGTRNYLVREAVMKPADGPELVGAALVLRIATAPVVGLAAVVWARVVGEGHQAATVLYLITAMTVLTLITEPLQAAFQAIERMKYLAYADIINKSAQSLIGIGLVLVGFNVVGLAANMAIIAVVVLVLTFWWLRPHFAVELRTSLARVGQVARQSVSYWAFGMFGMVYFWIDTIMLSLMTRPQVVGWYGVPSQLFQTLMFLPVLLQTAWLPRLVNAFASGERELAKTARTPVEMILTISVPIAVATGLLASPLIHAVYGAAFAHAVPVMVILAFCIPPIYLNIILASVLLAARRQRVWTMVMAGAAVINPLLNVVLIPLTEHRYGNGAIGASIALVLTEVLMDAVGFFLVGRNVFDRRMVRRCALMCLASAGMAGAAYATAPVGRELSLTVGFATFCLLAFVLRVVRAEELAAARAGLARVRRGGAAPAGRRAARPAGRDTPSPSVEGLGTRTGVPAGEAAAWHKSLSSVERSFPAGDVNAALAMARRLELRELLDATPSRERDLCVAMILGRVISGSALGTVAALGQSAPAGESGVAGVDEDDLNAAVGWLLDRHDQIEDRLVARYLVDRVPLLYDVCSDGADPDLRAPSDLRRPRERESRRPQLAYGLLCDMEGRPVAIESFVGRPRHERVLRSQTAKLKRRFGLSGVVVVADGRLFTEGDFEQLPVAGGVDWITALNAATMGRCVQSEALQPPGSELPAVWEIAGICEFPDERLIGCRDASVGGRRARRRDELMSATERELAAVADLVDRGVLQGSDRIWRAVGPVLNRYRMRTYIQVTITGETLTYARDADGIAAAEALDGVSVLRTTLCETVAPAPQVLRLYDNLARADAALGSSEDPDFERLLFRQAPEDRLRARALVCMLAYHLTWHLQAGRALDRMAMLSC